MLGQDAPSPVKPCSIESWPKTPLIQSLIHLFIVYRLVAVISLFLAKSRYYMRVSVAISSNNWCREREHDELVLTRHCSVPPLLTQCPHTATTSTASTLCMGASLCTGASLAGGHLVVASVDCAVDLL